MGKFYAVKNGRKPGIYSSWDEAREQVEGFTGAAFKSFKDKESAMAFLKGEEDGMIPVHEGLCAYVDGSYDSETGRYSFGAVILNGDKTETMNGVGENEDAAAMRNVAGELKGAMTVMQYALKNGFDSVTIYHDYEGIAAWAEGRWKTNLPSTAKYREFSLKMSEKLRIKFVKVPAHRGVKYNEMADKLAKEALKKQEK